MPAIPEELSKLPEAGKGLKMTFPGGVWGMSAWWIIPPVHKFYLP